MVPSDLYVSRGVMLLIFAFIFSIYLLPTIIAFARGKDNKEAIFALNFFVGWTLVGWIMCFVWALTKMRL